MLAMLWLLACSDSFLVPVTDAPTDVVLAEDSGVIEVSALRLNEVQTRNDSTVMDRALAFSDWIELYNGGERPVSLADVTLSDGDAEWDGADRELAPGGRLLLWADGSEAPGHAPFTLDSGGEKLTLSVAGIACDRLATGEMGADAAWARYPDGGAWAYTVRPTPDATNGSDPGRSTDPSDVLFPDDHLLTFELTLPQASIDALAYDPYTEVPAGLAWGPAWFPDVGVRIKGVYGSLRAITGKAAFKVDLNATHDHRLRGLETLTFNNMVQDPSYAHEALAYAFFRAMGLPAPRTAWMRLIVNGEDWGLYLHVESIDDTFLARWWSDPSGRLYEGKYGDDFTAGEETSFEYDEGPEAEDRSDIIAVTTILDRGPSDGALADLEALVDMDQILRELAVEAVLLHWDGYTTANNYRIYHDPLTDRFQMIPWGADQTLHDVWYGPYDGIGELLQFCIANAGCLARYNAELLAAADAFESANLEAALDDHVAFLAAAVAADTRGEFSPETIAVWVSDTRTVIQTSPERIRTAVASQ